MPASPFNVWVNILGSISPSVNQSINSVTRGLKGMQLQIGAVNTALRGLGRVAGFVGGLLAIGGITAGLRETVRLSTENEQLQEELLVIMKNQRALRHENVELAIKDVQALNAQAVQLQKQTGIYKNIFEKGSAILAQTHRTPAEIERINYSMANLLVSQRMLGRSTESLPELYSAVGKAIHTGMARNLNAVGVILSAREKQLLMWNAKMMHQADNVKIILGAIDRTFGGEAAQRMRTLLGQADLAGENAKQSMEAMGDSIKPVLLQLKIMASEVLPLIVPLVKEMADLANKFLADHMKDLRDWIKYMESKVVPVMVLWIDKGWKMLIQSMDWLRKNSSWFIPWLKELVIGVGALTVALRALRLVEIAVGLANPFTAIALAAGIAAVYVIEHWTQVKRFFIDMWQKIVGTKAADPKNLGYGYTRKFPKGVVPRAQPVEIGVVAWARQMMPQLKQIVLDWLRDTAKNIQQWLREVGDNIDRWRETQGVEWNKAITSWLSESRTSIFNWLQDIDKNIPQWLGEIGDNITRWRETQGVEWNKAIASWLNQAGTNIFNWLQAQAPNWNKAIVAWLETIGPIILEREAEWDKLVLNWIQTVSNDIISYMTSQGPKMLEATTGWLKGVGPIILQRAFEWEKSVLEWAQALGKKVFDAIFNINPEKGMKFSQSAQEHEMTYRKQYSHEHPELLPGSSEYEKAINDEMRRWDEQQKAGKEIQKNFEESTKASREISDNFNRILFNQTGAANVGALPPAGPRTEPLNAPSGGGKSGGGPGRGKEKDEHVYNPLGPAPTAGIIGPLRAMGFGPAAGDTNHAANYSQYGSGPGPDWSGKYKLMPDDIALSQRLVNKYFPMRSFVDIIKNGQIVYRHQKVADTSWAGSRDTGGFEQRHVDDMGYASLVASAARGGIAGKPVLSVLGERVPEAVIPLERTRRSRALLNTAASHVGEMGGGGGINITYNVTNNIQGGADLEHRMEAIHRRHIDRMQRDIAEVTYRRNRATFDGAEAV